MKKVKRLIVCLVLPVVILAGLTLAIVLPLLKTEPKPSAKEFNQVEYARADETGAGSADKSQKGGAIYLESNSTFTMKGGTISGHTSTYGGAIFVSSGATFTMTGGTITGCKAQYGGAIYVASGGTCNINGGKITGNTAEVAPAIYVEEGGKLFLTNDPEIEDNTVGKFMSIGDEVVLGASSGSTKLKTIEFGSYPQTYVGSTMNSTLESWFSTSSPKSVKTYTLRTYTWEAYSYTDGSIYARGTARGYSSSSSVYKDGTTAGYGTAWFKVEPISWFILNYDAWKAGEEDLELYSQAILASNIYFNASGDGNSWETSYIRDFCNKEFINTAFDESEKEMIKDSTIGNNVTGDYNKATSDSSGTPTTDKIYLKSYYEMGVSPFTSSALREASGSDFAIANSLYCSTSYSTVYSSQTTSPYWPRSVGSSVSSACYVDYDGDRGNGRSVVDSACGVRPALHLDL